MDELNPLALPSSNPQISQTSQRPKVINALSQFDKLPVHKQLAVELRLMGAHYETIGDDLRKDGHKYTNGTIRTWFHSDDADHCGEIYREMKETKTKERLNDREKGNKMLNDSVVDALLILNKGLADKHVSKTQMESAKEILDRAGFGRQTKQDSNVQVESDSIKELTQILRDAKH